VSVRLGVIADIHGNDVALRAVLADASRLGVERWWALGDLVLFGPRPTEVLEIRRELPCRSTSRPSSRTCAGGVIPRRNSSPLFSLVR